MPSLSMERQGVEEPQVVSSSNSSSNEVVGAMSQALVMVDKKVRNLEKRKTRLDALKADAERGKTLESDQLQAIERYDHVIQMLDFVREMAANLRSLAAEEERARKKAAKKEAGDKARNELKRIAKALEHQHYLHLVHTEPERVLADLDEESRILLADFAKMTVESTSNDNEESSTSGFLSAAEHLLALQDGRNKAVLSTNYKELRSLLDSLVDSHLRQTSTPEECEEAKEEVTKREESSETESSVAVVENQEPEQSPSEVLANEASSNEVPSMTFVNNQQQHVAEQQMHPSSVVPPTVGAPINFMQESQIDLESPHMDPAVVAVLPPVITPNMEAGVVVNPTQGFNGGLPAPFRAPVPADDAQHPHPEPHAPSRTEPESNALPTTENAPTPQDTMTNITDWEGGDPKNGERPRGHEGGGGGGGGGHRGWRGGRGRGGRGRGGHYRGHYEDRGGERRGGRGGYRGRQQHYDEDGRREFRRGGRGRGYGGHHNEATH